MKMEEINLVTAEIANWKIGTQRPDFTYEQREF